MWSLNCIVIVAQPRVTRCRSREWRNLMLECKQQPCCEHGTGSSELLRCLDDGRCHCWQLRPRHFFSISLYKPLKLPRDEIGRLVIRLVSSQRPFTSNADVGVDEHIRSHRRASFGGRAAWHTCITLELNQYFDFWYHGDRRSSFSCPGC